MKYNIKLTIKAIIRTEQLIGKPFSEIDYQNEHEVYSLLYCTILVNNNLLITFEEFKEIAGNKKQFSTMIKELESINKIISQFQTEKETPNTESGEKEPQYLRNIAAALIANGINASFVMNEMEIPDIHYFAKAIEQNKKEEMEAGRLWTYLSILPHVDTKKMKSAQDLMLFPWEKENYRKKAEKEMTEMEDMLHKFKSGELLDPNKIVWTKRENYK